MAQTTTIFNLLREAEPERWKLHQQGYRRGLLTFNVVSRWTLSEKLYQRAAIDFPMMMQLSTVNIGTTSFDMQQTYIEMSSSPAHDYDGTSVSPASCVDEKPGQDKPLAFRVNRVVIVDIATRKVAPLPNDLVDDLSSLLCEAAEDCRLSFVRPPAAATDKTFKCRVTVRFDDVDFQGHTNTSSYLGFAMECASQAAARGFYSAIRGDVACYRPKTVTSVFLSESIAGDELDVSTWEAESNPLLLSFVISNKGRVLNHSQIEYFDNETFE